MIVLEVRNAVDVGAVLMLTQSQQTSQVCCLYFTHTLN